MDHNNTTFNNNYNINSITEITQRFLSDNNFTTHNDTNTFYINQQPISCIDHIYSNIPHKVTHITTLNTGQSDHAILTAKYHSKAPITPPNLYSQDQNIYSLNTHSTSTSQTTTSYKLHTTTRTLT